MQAFSNLIADFLYEGTVAKLKCYDIKDLLNVFIDNLPTLLGYLKSANELCSSGELGQGQAKNEVEHWLGKQILELCQKEDFLRGNVEIDNFCQKLITACSRVGR
jgi:hypothetical protein